MEEKCDANYGGQFIEDNLWRTIYRRQIMEEKCDGKIWQIK